MIYAAECHSSRSDKETAGAATWMNNFPKMLQKCNTLCVNTTCKKYEQ